MGFFRKLISFVFPITDTYESDHSGKVDVTTLYGEVTLNTPNANYSYGSLQRVLKKGLNEIDLAKVESILLLGVAGGSVIVTLRKELKFDGHITGVEIDPMMLELAEDLFSIKSDPITELILDDAFEFVKSVDKVFDLIIVDLFIDNVIPQALY